ncbi:MAG: DNA polymerase domain-containing protein, partial [Candidatus Thorarchaeota archaeon]
ELRTKRTSPSLNINEIGSIIERYAPVKNVKNLIRFLPFLVKNDPGILEFLKTLNSFVTTLLSIEQNEDILEFEPMSVIVCKTEKEMIEKFCSLIELEKPEIITDFNGSKFDLPFIHGRANYFGIPFKERTGISLVPKIGIKEYEIEDWLRDVDSTESFGLFHIDAYFWTLKYSYLPKGMQGLKPAVKAKLKIIPIGREALWQLVGENNSESNLLDEESNNNESEEDGAEKNENIITDDDIDNATNTNGNSAEAVAYSGSDAYVTWLYTKEIILDFIFSMGNLFPVNSNELLSVNAGTLDDLLIDAISHHNEIVALKKYKQLGVGKFSENLNVEGITYTGGFVDSPHPGIWRNDLIYPFTINQDLINELLGEVPEILTNIENKKLIKVKKDYFLEEIKNFFPSGEDYFDFEKSIHNDDLQTIYKQLLIIFPSKKNEIEKILSVSDSLELLHPEKNKELIITQLKKLQTENLELNGNVVHLDVTSMYPSQIRQYKIQPSGIVKKSDCINCKYREKQEKDDHVPICAFDSSWTAKANLKKPCIHKIFNNQTKYPNGICSLKKEKYPTFQSSQNGNKGDLSNIGCEFPFGTEASCNDYSMGKLKDQKSYEFFKLDSEKKLKSFKLENSQFIEVPLESTYLARGFKQDKHSQDPGQQILQSIQTWVQDAINGAEINFTGDNPFIIENKEGENIEWDGFLVFDISQKNSSMLISLNNRFCQKAYDHVAAIMDDFFQLRVFHKQETKRLKRIIKEKEKRGEKIPEEIENKVKFHDSTQLGLKVPLNSIYGLLGMKGGVHNASPPSAGVTTSQSVKLIRWAADYLGGLGPITEMDTDGIWIFVPREIPAFYPIKIGFFNKNSGNISEYKDESIPLLESILNKKVSLVHEHKHYWSNNHKSGIKKTESRNLFKFEQDGPYSFQYVQGKKKYIVYNYTKLGKWEMKELTGLETKRRDFSKLHKELQELIIQSYLGEYLAGTSLKKLYLNAIRNVEDYIDRIKNGNFDDSYFIIPRSINNHLESYKSIGPDVTVGLILRDDFGYSIEPGTTVQYYHINPVKDKKTGSNLVVIPKIFFEIDLDLAKKFLKNHGIGYYTTIRSMDDIKSHLIKIDYQKYINELTGPGKIVWRMIDNVAMRQNVLNLGKPGSKKLSEFFSTKPRKKLKKESKSFKLSKEPMVNSSQDIDIVNPSSTLLGKKDLNITQKNKLQDKIKDQSLDSEIKIIIDKNNVNLSEKSDDNHLVSFLDFIKNNTNEEDFCFICPICEQSIAAYQYLPGNLCPNCKSHKVEPKYFSTHLEK